MLGVQLPDNLSFSLLLSGAVLVILNRTVDILKSIPRTVWNVFLRRFSVTIEIPENNHPFSSVRQFLSDQEYVFRSKDFSVVALSGPDLSGPPLSVAPRGKTRWAFPPAPGQHCFKYRGHYAVATRNRRELDGSMGSAIFETLSVRFFFAGQELIRRFLDDAELATNTASSSQAIYRVDFGCTSWTSMRAAGRRPMDSVVMETGLAEAIVADFGEFLGSGPWYNRMGLPYRRGYMLHGPPGNGKSSLVRAVTSSFEMGIAVLSLNNSWINDDKLAGLVAAVPASTALLIEDIDCVFVGRTPGTNPVTFSGLLNAIDGVGSPEGLVLFMTTNHVERLDPALVRPGRADRHFHVGNVVPEQARRYFTRFYGPGYPELALEFAGLVGDGLHSMAALQNVFLAHKDEPGNALAQFRSESTS